MNLGGHVGDDALTVGGNRALLAERLNVRPVYLEQVHGRGVIELNAHTLQGTQADACHTKAHSVACTIMVADCLPVLYTDLRGSFVAAAHAGWRGLAGEEGVGVLEALHATLVTQNHDAREMLVWLGPCIGPSVYEVDGEVKAAFEACDARAAQCFKPLPGGKWLADLPALARQRLSALGIKPERQIFGNDGSEAWCTYTQASRFYSHRRDQTTGRMAACIWRV